MINQIEDILNNLADEEFETLDELTEAAYWQIDDSLILSQDIYELVEYYVSANDLIQFFIEEYTNDVFAALYNDKRFNKLTRESKE